MSTGTESAVREVNGDELRRLVKDTYPRLYPEDVELYIAECDRRKVHPLSRLIVPRPNSRKGKDGSYVRGGAPAWITTIDLMRAKADETETYAPGRDTEYQVNERNEIVGAKAFVKKFVKGQCVEFSESADWFEFYPGDGIEGAMWRQMPKVMLSKVAEARALRRGWPAQLHGMYESAEMDRSNHDPEPKPATQPAPEPKREPEQQKPIRPAAPIVKKTAPVEPEPVPESMPGVNRETGEIDLMDDATFREEWRRAVLARNLPEAQGVHFVDFSLKNSNLTMAQVTLEKRRDIFAKLERGGFDEAIRKLQLPEGSQPSPDDAQGSDPVDDYTAWEEQTRQIGLKAGMTNAEFVKGITETIQAHKLKGRESEMSATLREQTRKHVVYRTGPFKRA